MITKRCGGYKGHWECEDGHPDHMVPVGSFSRKTASYLQSMCVPCTAYAHKIGRPRHPVVGILKNKWKHKIAEAMGGIQGTSEWQSYLGKAEEQWKVDHDIFSPKWLAYRKLPKVDRPKGRRVTIFKPDDPRGFVYVFKDKMKRVDGWLYYYKVGASHDPQERLNQANTWGDFESVYESKMVDDCASLEKEVHQALSKYRAKGEWFQCDKTFIINKIQELVYAREEQAMAEQKVS